MDRKMSARDEQPLRTLGDDELSAVSGACHGHRRRRHQHHGQSGDDQFGGAGGLAWLTALLQQFNASSVIQIVTGDNNTVVADVSQINAAGLSE
jgi:hypothetical protein